MDKGKKRIKFDLGSFISHLLLVALSLVMIIPFLWMISSSLKDLSEIFAIPVNWIPKSPVWRNYSDTFDAIPFVRYYANNIFISVTRVFILFFTASIAGYAFARLKFKGKDIIFFCFLATMMIPIHVIMYPTFLVIQQLGLIDTYAGLIIPQALGAFGGAFSIYLFKANFEAIPIEIEEAAIIDGASKFQIYFRVMLPMIRPAAASFVIFAFNGAWNDFVYPLVVTNSEELKMLSLGLQDFVNPQNGLINWPLMMAAAVMSIFPIIIVFIFNQKQFIENQMSSGVKG